MRGETSELGRTGKKNNPHPCAQYATSFLEKYLSMKHKPHTVAHLLPATPLFSFTEPPLLSVSVVRHQDSPLWLAVCHCRGEGVATNLAWALPENAASQMSLHSEYEGDTLTARLTYQFPLALHEGQDLTCVYQFAHGITVNKTLRIPRYCECSRNNSHPNKHQPQTLR